MHGLIAHDARSEVIYVLPWRQWLGKRAPYADNRN